VLLFADLRICFLLVAKKYWVVKIYVNILVILFVSYCSITMSSSFTLDKVLATAKTLVTRLKDQEISVDGLLSQTRDMGKNVEAMKMVSKSLLTFVTCGCWA